MPSVDPMIPLGQLLDLLAERPGADQADHLDTFGFNLTRILSGKVLGNNIVFGGSRDAYRLLIDLLLLAQAAQEWVSEVGGRRGLNFHQLVLMLNLLDGPRRPAALAGATGQPKTRVGMQLTSLVEKGLCKKSKGVARGDGRAIFYELTPKGQKLLERVNVDLWPLADAIRSRTFPRESAIAGWLESCAVQLSALRHRRTSRLACP